MKPQWTDADLAVLGLTGAELGAPESLAIPGAEVAHGLGRTTSATLAAVAAAGALQSASLDEVASETARGAGVQLYLHHDNPSLVLAESEGAGSVDVRCRHRDSRVARSEDDAETLVVDLSEGPAVVVGADGERIVLVREGAKLEIMSVQPPGATAPELGDLTAPVTQWSEETGDPWLREQVEARLASDGGWSLAVSAGMTARLAEPTSAEEARRIVERTLAGEVVESLVQARRWARALSSDQKSRLEAVALARADGLVGALHRLDSELALDDASWMERLRDTCTERDDLEGIRLLLDEGGEGQRLVAALSSLDEEGTVFFETLPRVVAFDDERLRRVALGDPDAWWGRFSDLAI